MTLPAPSSSGTVTIESDVLGPVTVPAGELWDFPSGLFGFEDCRSFALVPAGRDGSFWLQSATHRRLAFLLIDPFVFFPGYAIELASADLARLGDPSQEDVVALAIVTIPAKREDPWTANLQGPVVLNQRTRRGFQCIIPGDRFRTREEFRPG